MEPILISDSELVEGATDAETFAGLVDWHEIAALVASGCPTELALEIAR